MCIIDNNSHCLCCLPTGKNCAVTMQLIPNIYQIHKLYLVLQNSACAHAGFDVWRIYRGGYNYSKNKKYHRIAIYKNIKKYHLKIKKINTKRQYRVNSDNS